MRYIFASGFASLMALADYMELYSTDCHMTIVWDKFFTSDEFRRVLGYATEENTSLAS